MAFDSAYANGTLVAVSRNFLQASKMAFNPGARDDSNFLGVQEIKQVSSAVSRIDANVTADNLTPLGITGYENNLVLAVVQADEASVQISETEFDLNTRERPRSTIQVKGVSARDGTATGPTVNLVAPTTAMMASLAVIIDAAGQPVVKNNVFRLVRVRNSTGSTMTAGLAVKFVSNVDGQINVDPTSGGGSDRFIGILAEDIPTLETGACYSGRAALVPRSVASFAGAANEGPCFSDASGTMDSVGSLQIGRWKHFGGAGTASVLLLDYIF